MGHFFFLLKLGGGGATKPPIGFSFFFHRHFVFFIKIFPPGRQQEWAWRKMSGNGLAEIKQISVAVCPSARPSVDNL